MIKAKNELVCYKQIEISSDGKLDFFLEKHSTKEGTFGTLTLQEGVIDFVFLNGDGKELSRVHINEEQPELLVPPASWHKVIPVSASFKAMLEFYCIPQRYFSKKYDLGAVHSDLIYVYQTYWQHLQKANILDVGCGSGRNLLYLAKMGHKVTGVDSNQNALTSIQEIVKQEHLLGVDTLLHDLNQPLISELANYDVIISTVALQFLNQQRVPGLLAELQNITKNGGYHFLVFPIYADAYKLPDFFTFLPQQKELYRLYQDSGWSVLEYKESVGHLHRKDDTGKCISGMFGLLLAQKHRSLSKLY